jgi:non-specific serine/threonine protein kinase
MASVKTELEPVIQEIKAAGSQLRGPDAEIWAARLDRDLDRVQQALAWLLDHDPTAGLDVALCLPDYWLLRGKWAEGRSWLERFTRAATDLTPTLRCRALSTMSSFAFRQGDNETARQFANEALAIARGLNDAALTVGALTRLARMGLRDNDPRESMRLCREALGLALEVGDEDLSLSPLHCLAEATRMDGDYEEAAKLYRQSLDLNRTRSDELMIAVETSNLAAVELQIGNLDAAIRLWRESLALAHRTANHYLLPYPVAGLGEVAAAQQDWDRATRLLGAASALFKASGAAMDPVDVSPYEEAVAAARSGLSAGFEPTWSSGESMTADEIVAFA